MNDLSQKRLLADQTQDLLDEKGLFMSAHRVLKDEWIAELMRCRDRRAQDEIVSRLQALDAVPERLKTAITNYKFAANQVRRHG